jgi:hypothetical protein
MLTRVALIFGGFAVGVLVTLAAVPGDDDSTVESPPVGHPTEKQIATVESADLAVPVPDDQGRDALLSPEQMNIENLPNTPQVYVDLLGPSYRSVTGEDLHWTFAKEIRHQAWAYHVETEIMQDVEDNDVAKWTVIEHIECREMTCEVAGYFVGDSKAHPQDIVKDIDRAIWWHEQFSVHSMRGAAGGMERFLIIITAQDFGDRIRPPRPLN